MVTVPLIALVGFGVFATHRWSDASPFHLTLAVLFGLLLAATPIGPGLSTGLENAGAVITKSIADEM